MKKSVLKFLSIALTLSLIVSVFLPFGTVLTAAAESSYTNILAGVIPTTFCSVDRDTYAFNYKESKVAGGELSTYQKHGFTETDGWERRPAFIDYLKMLTDEDESLKLSISTTDTSKYKIMMVYELPEVSDVKAIEFVLSSWDDNLDVFVSSKRDTVFDEENMVANVVRAENNYTTPNYITLNKPGIKFLGVYIRDVYDSGINEIRVYADAPESKENLLHGKTPVAAYAVAEGTTNWAYRPVGNKSTNTTYFGTQTKPATSSNDNFTAIAELFTDGYTSTVSAIKNEMGASGQSAATSDDVLLAYKLDDFATVNGVALFSDETSRNTRVYMSLSYASLFNAENMVAAYTSNAADSGFSLKLGAPRKALYIGFVFECEGTAGQKIAEIAVYGDAPEKENYSAVLGKSTVNPNANAETKNFYNYLASVGESANALIGAEINTTNGNINKRNNDNNYYEFIEAEYGVSPAIVSTTNVLTDIEYYKQYYSEGSIPLMQIGIDSATVDAIESGKKTGYIKYFDNEYEPDADEEDMYYDIQEEISVSLSNLADFFEELETAGVKTYIVRPFIEMNIKGLFGNKYYPLSTTYYFKRVWQQMVDYFVNERGLKGIMFAFSPCGKSGSDMLSPMSYYPGDDYVDIIAPTVYSQTNDAALYRIVDYSDMLATGKPFAISELGMIKRYDQTEIADCLTLLDNIKTVYPEAAFVNLWYGSNFGIDHHLNSREFITDDYFIDTQKMSAELAGVFKPNAVLYPETCFAGNPVAVWEGNYSSVSGAKSLKVSSGYSAKLYESADFAGSNYSASGEVSNIADKGLLTVSSVKIEKSLPHDHTGGTATCHSRAICEICGGEYGELNYANHDGGFKTNGAIAATCTAAGYTGDTYCLGCGAKIAEGAVTELALHTPGKWILDVAATTESAGLKHRVCTVCGATEEEVIDKIEMPNILPGDGVPEISVESKTAKAGDTVDVKISLKNNPGISSMKLVVTYGSGLTLKSPVVYDICSEDSTDMPQTMQPQSYLSPVTLNWISPLEEKTGDTVFATLTFEVAADANNDQDITVFYNPKDVFNANEENVGFAVTNGKVSINSDLSHVPGDINGDGRLNNKDLTRLFQYLSDWDVEVNEPALDINGDGRINNKDLTRLFQYLSDWDVVIF